MWGASAGRLRRRSRLTERPRGAFQGHVDFRARRASLPVGARVRPVCSEAASWRHPRVRDRSGGVTGLACAWERDSAIAHLSGLLHVPIKYVKKVEIARDRIPGGCHPHLKCFCQSSSWS